MGEDDKNADWQLESLLYDMAKDPSDARAVTQILMAYIRDSRAVQAQADLALRDMATRWRGWRRPCLAMAMGWACASRCGRSAAN